MFKKMLLLVAVSFATSLHAQTTVEITSLKAIPAKPSMYKLSIQLDQALDADAEIVIDFPEKFDLATIKIAGSNDINGGIEFTAVKNRLTLKRSGLGAPVASGNEVSIIFGPIVNPVNMEDTGTAEIEFNAKNIKRGKIKQNIKFE